MQTTLGSDISYLRVNHPCNDHEECCIAEPEQVCRSILLDVFALQFTPAMLTLAGNVCENNWHVLFILKGKSRRDEVCSQKVIQYEVFRFNVTKLFVYCIKTVNSYWWYLLPPDDSFVLVL